jgi:Tn3 transposase DDE domain
LKKGIVSYTHVANHVPLNARIIGANEHESHYVFDLLYNNTTDIQPSIHSTDTHGTNEVNFAILAFFGYQFAPRYNDIRGKMGTLYGFKHPSQYDKESLFKPASKANTKLILAEEDNIQHILASLALKVTRRSVIIAKLSSYPRKNRTKRAMWELDNLRRSLHLLNYVDFTPVPAQHPACAQPRRVLSQTGARGRVCQRRQIASENRSGATALERMLAAAGQLHHLLQCLHPIGIARARRAPAGLPKGRRDQASEPGELEACKPLRGLQLPGYRRNALLSDLTANDSGDGTFDEHRKEASRLASLSART